VSNPEQADRDGIDRSSDVRARLYCGSCGRLLQRFEVDPDHPDALPRIWGPANPSGSARRRAKANRDSYQRTDPAGMGDFRHRHRCECGADWQSGSYRLGRAILAKARATDRRSVRIVAGQDV
jgi:hypothetical protein